MSSDIKPDRSRTLASPSNRMIAENPENRDAGVVELVDTGDLKSPGL